MAWPGRALSQLWPALCQDGCARAAGFSPVHTINRGTSAGRFVEGDDVARPAVPDTQTTNKQTLAYTHTAGRAA